MGWEKLATVTYVDNEVSAGDTSLADTKIWIGDSEGAKAEFALSGAVTMTAGGAVTLADASSAATSFTSPLIEGSTSVQTPLIEFTDGDNAIVITDTGLCEFPVATTHTGGVQTATIDYTDGDLAMTIADGGAVTFAQDATFSGTVTSSGVVTGTGFTAGSAVLSEAELEKLDGITNGTVAASKAVVVDANKDIGTLRNLTIDGTFSDGNYTFDTSGNVSGLGTIGSGAITSSGIVTGTAFTAGSAVLAEAELELLDGLTAGTAIASKVVTTDANIDSTGMRNLTITGTFSDGNYTFDTSGNVSGLGTVGSGAVTSSGAVEGTSITDGTATMTSGNLASVGTIGCGAITSTAAISATDLTLSGGDLTYNAALSVAGQEVTAGTGLALNLSAGNAKDGGGTDINAGALTIAGGQGTGTGDGGSIFFKVAQPSISTGTAKNALATALTIEDDLKATFAGATVFSGGSTFSGTVTIAGNLDVNGTTTTIESANTAIVDAAIVLNKTKDLDTFGQYDAAIIFGDSTGLTSTGKIINNNTTGFQFTDGSGASANTPSDATMNSATAGTGYKNLYMQMPVMKTLATSTTAIAGALLFDGTDFYVGT